MLFQMLAAYQRILFLTHIGDERRSIHFGYLFPSVPYVLHKSSFRTQAAAQRRFCQQKFGRPSGVPTDPPAAVTAATALRNPAGNPAIAVQAEIVWQSSLGAYVCNMCIFVFRMIDRSFCLQCDKVFTDRYSLRHILPSRPLDVVWGCCVDGLHFGCMKLNRTRIYLHEV